MANILITRHDKIGDFVVALPMFKVLKEQRPELKLIALVSKVNLELAQRIDFIDDVILYDKANLDHTLAQIKAADIDLSISAFINTSLAWLLFRSGIKTRIAPATKLAQLLFNRRVVQRRSRVEKREFEYNLDLLHAFDPTLTLRYQQPLLSFTSEHSQQLIAHFRQTHGLAGERKLLGFHMGSGGSAEGNLSLAHYLALAKHAAAQPNSAVVFTFGPDDTALKAQLEAQLDFPAIIFDSSSSIADFTTLLSHFSLLVSTSTGPMHLAAANNIATFSFFGENLVSTPARWASVSEAHKQHNIILPNGYSDIDFQRITDEFSTFLKQLSLSTPSPE
ncbi:MAG: glycosyltransferase family 9 protein [Pseudomonadales bacterium]